MKDGYYYKRCNYVFMKGNIGILMVIAVMCPPCLPAWGIPVIDCCDMDLAAINEYGCRGVAARVLAPTVEALAECLDGMAPFAAEVTYDVSLPMLEDDVIYKIEVASDTVKGDFLSPVDYLIRWSLPSKDGGDPSTGFLAYFDGHHYRYRDNRLQEYHYEWDSIPFQTAQGGVQSNGQFVELLPQSIARELKSMINSGDYTVGYEPMGVVDGRDVSIVTASQSVRGFTGRNYRLIVERGTGRPLQINNEYNPGQISEQAVTIRYTYDAVEGLTAVTSEEVLMEMYPEVFERFRESNYRIENLRGVALPSFSLPTLTGERYSRQRGDRFKAPTVIAIIDPQVATAAATVKTLREVVAQMPRDIDLLLAFMGSNADLIEEVAGASGYSETDLISAKSLARDCGTSVFPTIIVVEPSGIVANVLLGFNNSLAEDVIQSLALIKKQ